MWPLILAHLFICVMGGRDGHCKQIPLGCVGSAHSGWTTLGLPQPKAMCPSWVYTARATGCSAMALFQVHLSFCELPNFKPLRFSGAPQGHRPKRAVHFVSFPVPSSSGNRVLGERTVRGGSCILIAFRGPDHLVSQVHCESTVPGMPCVFSGELISGCYTPGRCQPSRIPGSLG